jgi:hypothetical protein
VKKVAHDQSPLCVVLRAPLVRRALRCGRAHSEETPRVRREFRVGK